MRAFLVTSRGSGEVRNVEPPEPGPDQVVVDVARAGICGTDMALFTGDETRIARARTTYPLRLGHEWSGTVSEVGPGVAASWLGRRVTGDTMLGCGHCARCLRGDHHVCEDRFEVGVRGGWAGALAEKLVMPTRALHPLPTTVTDAMGALVEPGGNAWRAVDATALSAGERLLIIGPGTIGLLCGMFALAQGVEVHLLGRGAMTLARSLGFHGVWTRADLPSLTWHAVIDASDGEDSPALAAKLVEPARRVVYIGISVVPSLVDSRTLVMKDVTAVGILGGSAGLEPTIEAYASGVVDPVPLIAATIGLSDLASELTGDRHRRAAPKIQIDPTL